MPRALADRVTTSRLLGLALVASAGLAGCATPSAPDRPSAPASSAPNRTLVMVVNLELNNLASKAVGPTNPARVTRLFNAGLVQLDAQNNAVAYLAEALPQLNTDSWRVFPDGRMETTWKLRPGLTWHDGSPLTVEDFAFAFQIYKSPGLGAAFDPKPQDLIDQISVVDPLTIRVSWRDLFLHQGDGLNPLPRALLIDSFNAFEGDPVGQRDSFTSLRFWTTEYVGAGPYRLTNWEPGAYLEGEAFDAHALGKPKIDRVQMRIMTNEDAVLAALMAGEVHHVVTIVLRFPSAAVLQEQGGFNDVEKKGKVLFVPTGSASIAAFQYRPEFQQTPGLLDLRVRQAIAHASDREAIAEALFEGHSSPALTFATPALPYFADLERTITKYPYDPKRAEQIMGEASYSRDRDGFFVGPSGQRFQPSLWSSGDSQQQREATIVVNNWQHAGIGVQPLVMSAALERDTEARSVFPGVMIHSVMPGEAGALRSLISQEIAAPSNRWNGLNRGGWSNSDFDRLWDRYKTTLDRAEQIQTYVQAMKLHSELVPSVPLRLNLQITAHVAGLKGPQVEPFGAGTTESNIHDWEWQ